MIRMATGSDKDALLDLQRRLDAQSSYMLLEPGERDPDPTSLQRRLDAQREMGSFDLVSTDGDKDGPPYVGWLAVDVAPYHRAAHLGYLVLGVDADAAGRGVGGALTAAAVAEASRRRLRRLELTVMTDNLRAIALYLRQGFEVEGLRRHAILRDREMVDEYYMSRLLPEQQ